MDTTPSTELEAVNVMLATIGEAPVSTLEELARTDVATAAGRLRGVTRNVLLTGYDFNTDDDYALAPDVDGFIHVPTDALKVDPTDPTVNVVERARKLWDRDDHTFVFTDSLKCDIVRFLPFEDVPEAARYYITVRAARAFQATLMGKDEEERYTEEEEFAALTALAQAHTAESDSTFIDDPDMFRMRRRRR